MGEQVLFHIACREDPDGMTIHYFSGGLTCLCGKKSTAAATSEERPHLRLVETFDEEKLDL